MEKKIRIATVDRCVMCGGIIPEGQQVCRECKRKTELEETINCIYAINRLLFVKEHELQLADKLSSAVIKMAIQALEKEIPKKPKIMDSTLVGEKFWWYCGHCGASRHTNFKSNYCSYCGGKVNWNEAES